MGSTPLNVATRGPATVSGRLSRSGSILLRWGMLLTALLSSIVLHAEGTWTPPRALDEVGRLGGAALAVSADERYAYVSMAGNIEVWDVRDVDRPSQIGSLAGPRWPRDMVAAGGLVYLAYGGAGVEIVDATEPLRPRFRGHTWTDGAADQVAIDGRRLYVAAVDGIRVVDVADPDSPELVGSWRDGTRVIDVATVRPGVVAVSYQRPEQGLGGGISLVDASVPSAPRRIGRLDLGGWAGRLAMGQDFVAMVDIQYLRLVSVADAAAMHELWVGGPAGTDLQVVGPTIFVWADDGIHILDASRPNQARELANVPGAVDGMAALPTRLLTLAFGGFRLYDVRDTGRPSLGYDGTTIGDLMAIDVEGDLAVTQDVRGYVSTVDVSIPDRPRYLGRVFGIADHRFDAPMSVFVRGKHAYAVPYGTMWGASLIRMNVEDPAAPVVDAHRPISQRFTSAAVAGDLLYTTNNCQPVPRDIRNVALNVWDLAAEDPPQWIRQLRIGDNVACENLTVAAAGGLTWVGSDVSGLHVVDTTNPEAMHEVARWDSERSVRALAASGRFGLIAAAGRLRLMELGDDEELLVHAAPDIPVGEARWLGNTLYLAADGWRIYDVTDPLDWRLIGRSWTPTGPLDVEGGVLYAATHGTGLQVMRPGSSWSVFLPWTAKPAAGPP